eukprot:4087235-Alexandrium_andersonii.AAC.1
MLPCALALSAEECGSVAGRRDLQRTSSGQGLAKATPRSRSKSGARAPTTPRARCELIGWASRAGR